MYYKLYFLYSVKMPIFHIILTSTFKGHLVRQWACRIPPALRHMDQFGHGCTTGYKSDFEILEFALCPNIFAFSCSVQTTSLNDFLPGFFLSSNFRSEFSSHILCPVRRASTRRLPRYTHQRVALFLVPLVSDA